MTNISFPGDSQQDDDGNVEASKSQVKTSMKIPLPGDSQDEDSNNEDSDNDDDEDGNESPVLLWSHLWSWPPLRHEDEQTIQDQRTDKQSHPVLLLPCMFDDSTTRVSELKMATSCQFCFALHV